MISLSYAKISFSDVAQKLQVDSPEDAEYIVAKVSFPMNLQKRVLYTKNYPQRCTEWLLMSRPPTPLAFRALVRPW
jgi:26S proteasome regulatory subunit N3